MLVSVDADPGPKRYGFPRSAAMARRGGMIRHRLRLPLRRFFRPGFPRPRADASGGLEQDSSSCSAWNDFEKRMPWPRRHPRFRGVWSRCRPEWPVPSSSMARVNSSCSWASRRCRAAELRSRFWSSLISSLIWGVQATTESGHLRPLPAQLPPAGDGHRQPARQATRRTFRCRGRRPGPGGAARHRWPGRLPPGWGQPG